MVLAKSVFDMFCLMECCSNYWIKNDIQELGLRLQKELIGQPLATDLIIGSIRSHIFNPVPSKSLVLSFHGGTGTGKNFVAKHIVESLYREGYRSKFVKLYFASRDFMHNDEAHVSQYKEFLTKEIEGTTKACQQAIFIFDEVNHIPKKLLDVIQSYIDFHGPTASRSTDFRKTIFIFLTNAGATSILKLVDKNNLSSIKRENYNVLEFQQALSDASFNEQGGLQSTLMIDRHLVTFFVPFLHLEREHVRGCIKRRLQVIRDNDEYEYELSIANIVGRVENLIEFTRSSLTSIEYSVSGCKKVSQKLDFVFESIRPTLTKRKKQLKKNDGSL